jgi:hypothetical protein
MGNDPTEPPTLTVPPEPPVEAETEVTGALDERDDAAGALVAGPELDAGELEPTVVTPAEHAASDSPAAQAATASAAVRYAFIEGFPSWGLSGQLRS